MSQIVGSPRRSTNPVGDDAAIAEEAGIGRATLYKYFSDAEVLLLAWHERQISAHLLEMDVEGDYPEVLWELAAAMAGKGTVPAGRQMSVEEVAPASLGC